MPAINFGARPAVAGMARSYNTIIYLRSFTFLVIKTVISVAD